MSDVLGMAEAIESLESELGQTFTWNGGSFSCVIGDRVESKELAAGGYGLAATLQVVVRKELFTGATPTSDEVIVVSGRSLSIASATHSPCGSFLVLACNDPTDGI